MNNENVALKTTIYAWGAKVIISASQFIILRCVLGIFTEIEYKDFLLIYVIYSATAQLADFGVGQKLHNRIVDGVMFNVSDIERCLLKSMGFGCVIAIPIAIIMSKFLGSYTHYGFYASYMTILLFIFQAHTFAAYRLMYAVNRGHLASVMTAIGWVFALVLIIASTEMHLSSSVFDIFLLITIPQAAIALLSWFREKKILFIQKSIAENSSFDWISLQELFRMLLIACAGMADNLIANRVLTDYEFSQFGTVYRFGNLMYFVAISYTYSSIPQQCRENSMRKTSALKLILRKGSGIYIIASILLIIASRGLFNFIDQSDKLNLSDSTLILSLIIIFCRYASDTVNLYTQISSLREHTVLATINLFFLVGAETVLGMEFGVFGIAIGAVISTMAYVLITLRTLNENRRVFKCIL